MHIPVRQAALAAILSVATVGICALAYDHFGQGKVIELEHGLSTDRVVATRYKGGDIGYSIGFRFPKDLANADRAEVFEFMAQKGGIVISGGGSPGAEMYVVFAGVSDRDTANLKLREILPELTRLMTRL